MSRAVHGRGTSPYKDDDSYVDDDNYSEDFEDDDAQSNRRYKTKSPLLRTGSYRDRSNRSRGRGNRGGRLTGRSSQEPKFDNIAKRVMSARRLKINELLNTNRELQLQIQDLKDENKLLKKMQSRQDKALKKYEEQESDLPSLIQRQNNESRSLKDQIRKWREKFEKTDRYLRDAEDELEKVKAKMKKLKMLADEKELPERAELNKKINKAELDMEEKDVKIRELERHIQNLEKNHRHELGIERARHRDVNKQLQQLRDENDKLSTNVKEKDKELQMKNIYANRMVKPPHRLPNSYSGTPHGTPPPARKRRQSLNETDGITPREKAKQMEERRREELRKQRELKQVLEERGSKAVLPSRPTNVHSNTHKTPRRARDMSPLVTRGRSPSIDRSRAITPKYPDDSYDTYQPQGKQHDKVKREQELRNMREREEMERDEREKKKREEDERREWEDKERRMNEEAKREEEERRNRQERDRIKQEAEERERKEKERREKEEKQRREKREKEERERRERERLEQERRAQEERRRFEDDVSLQAERRKKDEILQKLREIDEGGQKPKEKDKFNDPFFVTQEKEESSESMGSKKSYKFTKPIENLHKGKPAVDKSRDRSVDDLAQGGYNPTFGSSRGVASKSNSTAPKTFSLFDDDEPKVSNKASVRPAQKSKLMEELFGSKADTVSKQDDIFAPSKPAPKKANQGENRPTAFPWDDTTNVKTSSLNSKRENSATLFGGGSALVNDEEIIGSKKTNSTSLRRPKQATTTFHTKPTVNAVDHFDDDIEEVML